MLLRLYLCVVSLFLLLGVNPVLADWQKWTLGGLAVLYNPIVPIYLGVKDFWIVLNTVTICLFWLISVTIEKEKAHVKRKKAKSVD